MSYLPRMSKTYKEPPLAVTEEPYKNTSSHSLKPASSLLNEKTYNPQMVLKHYGYLPHAPPVLPGPSVLDEVQENELFREVSKMRRSSSKIETVSKASESILDQTPLETCEATVEENELKQDSTEKIKRAHNRKGLKAPKTSLGGRRRSSKSVKKENTSNITVNMCLTAAEKPFTATEVEGKSQSVVPEPEFLSRDELGALKCGQCICPVPSEDLMPEPQEEVRQDSVEERPEVKQKEFTSRSVQCTIFGSPSKVFVIPPIINSLLRTLAFLLHEINKEAPGSSVSSEEKKFPMTQIQLILSDLCNQKVEKDYGFDVTYSDTKRLERIFGEFQKYMKDAYGDRGEHIDKLGDLKRVFVESKTKEMDLAVLSEKLQNRKEKQNMEEEIVLREEDLKNLEITLQNKRLENEQLTAEVEFSSRELKEYQKAIAELDWDIRNYQEQMVSLKKSVVPKSKTEDLGRKSSIVKFSSEILSKTGRNKNSERSFMRKT